MLILILKLQTRFLKLDDLVDWVQIALFFVITRILPKLIRVIELTLKNIGIVIISVVVLTRKLPIVTLDTILTVGAKKGEVKQLVDMQLKFCDLNFGRKFDVNRFRQSESKAERKCITLTTERNRSIFVMFRC